LAGAVAKRRSEFLAGRLCAALALRAAGLPQEVPRKGRAPLWPEGIVGAISHSDSRAIAVISRLHSGLGVDCEEIMPLARAEALHQEILTAEELALRPAALPFATFVTLVFSAKEALYKALSQHLTHIPGFLEVRLTGIMEDRLALNFAGASREARFRLTAEDCVTLMALR
jgi:enterobactin synthetase component D